MKCPLKLFALFFLSLQQIFNCRFYILVQISDFSQVSYVCFFLVNAHKSHSRGGGTKAYIKKTKKNMKLTENWNILCCWSWDWLVPVQCIIVAQKIMFCCVCTLWSLEKILGGAWSWLAAAVLPPRQSQYKTTRLARCRVAAACLRYSCLQPPILCVLFFSAGTCGVSFCLGFVSNSSPTIHLSWALATTDNCCLLVLYYPQGIILNSTWQPLQYSMDICGIICSQSEGDQTNWDPPIGGAFITIQDFPREFTLIDTCPWWTHVICNMNM